MNKEPIQKDLREKFLFHSPFLDKEMNPLKGQVIHPNKHSKWQS